MEILEFKNKLLNLVNRIDDDLFSLAEILYGFHELRDELLIVLMCIDADIDYHCYSSVVNRLSSFGFENLFFNVLSTNEKEEVIDSINEVLKTIREREALLNFFTNNTILSKEEEMEKLQKLLTEKFWFGKKDLYS